ncbi:MAG: glycosyltransferase [bacterium]|nr:glycosyltransferase [bacterium]
MGAGSATDPVRLLVVTHSLSVGGAERFASNLLGGLDRDRFAPQICLVTDKSTYPLPADVPVSTLGYRGIRDLPRTLLRLKKLMTTERPDVVLSNVVATNCLTGGAVALLRDRPPWVARIGMAPGVGEPRTQQWWSRAVYPLARKCVTNSRRMQDAFESFYPGTAGRCTSIPNPTDFSAIDQLADEPPARRSEDGVPTLLFIGRLKPQKRPDVLLQALNLVRRRMDVRLWICGDGPLRGAVEAQIAELGLGEAVEILGFQDNPFALLRQADLFVSTSDFEGLPNALIEAQGLGAPAVATRCPFGPDEIVEDGVTGRLVEMGDAEAVAGAIVEILEDRDRCATMGEAARERARRLYDLPRVMPQWQDLLVRAAGRDLVSRPS